MFRIKSVVWIIRLQGYLLVLILSIKLQSRNIVLFFHLSKETELLISSQHSTVSLILLFVDLGYANKGEHYDVNWSHQYSCWCEMPICYARSMIMITYKHVSILTDIFEAQFFIFLSEVYSIRHLNLPSLNLIFFLSFWFRYYNFYIYPCQCHSKISIRCWSYIYSSKNILTNLLFHTFADSIVTLKYWSKVKFLTLN